MRMTPAAVTLAAQHENEEMIEMACDARWVPETGTEYVCLLDAGHGGDHRGPARAWTGRRPDGVQSWLNGAPPAPEGDPDAVLVGLARAVIDSGQADYAKVALLIDLMASAAQERTGR